MTRLFHLVLIASFALPGALAAQDATPAEDTVLPVLQANDVDLNDFLWVARPVVVFADSPNDPRFAEQVALLADRPDALAERDVVVIVDAERGSGSQPRTQLRPRGFMLVIMDKDGEVELRKPAPWDVREITRTIDKMPSRQQELRFEAGG
jgi:hypothetical protein